MWIACSTAISILSFTTICRRVEKAHWEPRPRPTIPSPDISHQFERFDGGLYTLQRRLWFSWRRRHENRPASVRLGEFRVEVAFVVGNSDYRAAYVDPTLR